MGVYFGREPASRCHAHLRFSKLNGFVDSEYAATRRCPHFPEEELKARVEDIQDRFFTLRNTALDALIDLINDIKSAKENGATDAQLAVARDYHRRGQFMIDFVMSENSMSFHAPQEAMRILGDAINLCRLGQLSLHGGPRPESQPAKHRGG